MASGKTAWDSCYQITVHVSFADGIALNTTTMFLYQKLIDHSTLRQGFQIPGGVSSPAEGDARWYASAWGNTKCEGCDCKDR